MSEAGLWDFAVHIKELCLSGWEGTRGHCWTKKNKVSRSVGTGKTHSSSLRPTVNTIPVKKKKALEVPSELLTLCRQQAAEFMVENKWLLIDTC